MAVSLFYIGVWKMTLQDQLIKAKQEIEEYYNLGTWNSNKFMYNKISKSPTSKRLQILQGSVWHCDLGFNVGTEKNKLRPVLIISNNLVNRTEKVVVLSITDAKGKVNQNILPAQDSWYLLYADTTDVNKMVVPNRVIRGGAIPYTFLDKDSIVQCEEIRAVSKARFDCVKGAVGQLTPNDLQKISGKFMRVYNFA
jgi:Growth inhibitor